MEKTCTVRLTFSKVERDTFKKCRKAYGWASIKEKTFIELHFKDLIELVKSFRQVRQNWAHYALNKGVRQIKIACAPEDWKKQLSEAVSTSSLPEKNLEILTTNINSDFKHPIKGIFHTFDELGYPSAYGFEQKPLPKEPKIQSPTPPVPEPSSNNTDGFKIWDMKRIWPLGSVLSEIADWRKIDEMIKSTMSSTKQTQDKLSQEQEDKDLLAKMEAGIADINAAAVVSGLMLLQDKTINEENLREVFFDEEKLKLLLAYLFPYDPPWPLIDTIDLGSLGISRTFDGPIGIKQCIIYTWNEICEMAKYSIAQIKASKDASGAIPPNIRDIFKNLELRCANALTKELKQAYIDKPQKDPIAEKTPNLCQHRDNYVTRPTESTIKGFEQDLKNLQKFINMCGSLVLAAQKKKQEEKPSAKPAQAKQSAETKNGGFEIDWGTHQLIYPDGRKIQIKGSGPEQYYIDWTDFPEDKQIFYHSHCHDLFSLTLFRITVVSIPKSIKQELTQAAATILEGIKNFKSL